MPSIFISYRRSDTGGHSGRLFDRLRCWFATEELFIDVDSIDWGDDFPEKIEEAICAAKVVLVIIGPDWLDSINERASQSQIDFVRREVSIALERRAENEVEIFPILVGSAKMPSKDMLNESLKNELGKLFDYNAHDFPAEVRQWDFQFECLLKSIASIDGVPMPEAQMSQADGQLRIGFADIEPMKRSTLVDVDKLQQVFGAVSTALLNWPQEIGGNWIERPELDHLYELIRCHELPLTVILSEPGGGKSAILARMGMKLASEGVMLLAIKADQLPKCTTTLHDLEDWIGGEIPATEALREIASNQPVVVLIDQLDALSDLMDQHTERLGSLIRLANTVRKIPNISVLLSCREFEYRNDVRFISLEAEELTLQRPTWEKVEVLLKSRGFETSGWSEEVRDVLRTPQHLAMFLDHQAGKCEMPLFSSYQGLLNSIVRERIELPHGKRAVQAAEAIAAAMAVDEELWLGRGRFEEKFSRELNWLEESGFLIKSENGLSIGFRHQTVFDFLRARGFLHTGQMLEEYVIDQKKQSLFVRPTIWSTLNFLRASDKSIYRKQFKALWIRSDLRLHIRNLLISFLGQIKEPDNQEAQWLFPGLEEESLRPGILMAISGSPGWFSRLQSRLAGFMEEEPERALEITPTLRAAASFDANTVLTAVRQHWMGDDGYLRHVWSVLREIKDWDEDGVDLICQIADKGPEDSFIVQDMANKISESRPDLAPKIVVRYLRAMTQGIDEEIRELDDGRDTDESIENCTEQAHRAGNIFSPYEKLIDNHSDWHHIEGLAQSCPKVFVTEVWPWLVELFTRLESSEHPYLIRYRNHQGLAFSRETSDRQPLQSAIEKAISSYAENEPEDFLEFLQDKKSSDLNVLHRLLAIGLEKIAKQYPQTVLEYLLEDTRRLAIGDMTNDHRDTQTLISATVPWLSPEEALRLEKAIKTWTWYRIIPDDEDAKLRRERKKWTRMRRLRLFKVFPFEQLSKVGKQYVREEERAFPYIASEDRYIRGGWIGSPMSSEQMEKATDDQILALFDELTDDTGWDHPKRRFTDFVGGSVQASRAFADFASKNPDRALLLISRFQARKTERPAGAALAKLAKSSVDPVKLISCVHELNARGFVSKEFRTDAAWCLGDTACHAGELNDRTCKLLESWIVEWDHEAETSAGDNTIRFTGNGVEEEMQQSLLWDTWQNNIVPLGNYPVLRALMRLYLYKNPPAVDEWLVVLTRHLDRNEDPKVWQEIAKDLWRLVEADRSAATKFFESLFSLYPDILHTTTGVSLIAQVMSWLPRKQIDLIINDWTSGSWKQGPQAAGEVLALHLCRNPEDTNRLRQIEQILSGDSVDTVIIDGMRVGITYTFSMAWSESALRALTTGYLVRLTRIEISSVDKALSMIFSSTDQLPADDHTRYLLEALLERPVILANGRHFLIEGLKVLLCDGWRPDLIYRITNALILEKSKDLGDIRTAWAVDAGDLADIALTLHRISDTQEQGLELFERLMEARSYGLDERIATIDRLAFR